MYFHLEFLTSCRFLIFSFIVSSLLRSLLASFIFPSSSSPWWFFVFISSLPFFPDKSSHHYFCNFWKIADLFQWLSKDKMLQHSVNFLSIPRRFGGCNMISLSNSSKIFSRILFFSSLTLSVLCISETCIKIKIILNLSSDFFVVLQKVLWSVKIQMQVNFSLRPRSDGKG